MRRIHFYGFALILSAGTACGSDDPGHGPHGDYSGVGSAGFAGAQHSGGQAGGISSAARSTDVGVTASGAATNATTSSVGYGAGGLNPGSTASPTGGADGKIGAGGAGGVTTRPVTGAVGGSQGTTHTTVAQAGVGASAGQGNVSSCESALTHPEEAIFVAAQSYSSTGTTTDADHCGTLQNPCSTITAAVAQAYGLQHKSVCVAKGTYIETVTLKPGIRVEGGWEIVDGMWRRIQTEDVNTAVKIQAPTQQNKTIIATELGGKAELSRLKVVSKTTAGPSESLYGIFASGKTTSLVLDRVDVAVDDGGSGKAGSSPSTTGTNGLATGTCQADATANAGKPGASVSNGADASEGTFNADGYVPANGGDGQPGNRGFNGFAGGDPGSPVSCGQGTPGVNGCGSGGGLGGQGGRGGGSTIALYVWDASVEVVDGAFQSRNGGNGGNGASGTMPGRPTLGKAGDAKSCSACIKSSEISRGAGASTTTCDVWGTVTSAGGLAGGDGGSGSPGATGGNGAGGFSYAVYLSPAAQLHYTQATTLKHGSPGEGPGDAKEGKSGETNRL